MFDFLPADLLPRVVFFPVWNLRKFLKDFMVILSLVAGALFLAPTGVGSDFLTAPVADFFPLAAEVVFGLLGVNLATLAETAGAAVLADFLADALAAAFAVLLAPPLTLAAEDEAAAAGFLAPPRVTTLVVPSLKFQSSFPAIIPCSTPPLEKSGTSEAGSFSRLAWIDLCLKYWMVVLNSSSR